MQRIHWDVLPNRKELELELMRHEHYPIRICTKPYGKFSPGAKRVLMKAIEKMPESKGKELSLQIFPQVRPPEVLKIHQSSEVRNKEKPVHNELLTNEYLNRVVNTLALNHIPSRKIHEIVIELDGEYDCTHDQIDKYLYRYWNTRPEHGWDIFRQQEFEIFLAKDHQLKSLFAFELENGFGRLSHLEVYLNLGIASAEQKADHLILNTMKKYNDTLSLIDLIKPGRVSMRRSESDVASEMKLQGLLLKGSRELSMMINRLSRMRADIQKTSSIGNGAPEGFRVYGRKPSSSLSGGRKYLTRTG